MIKTLWASVQGDPVFMRKVNGWATVIWLVAAVPICVFFSSSVPFLVFISVYAVVTGHLSAWQAARVEVVQNEDANVADVMDKLDDTVDQLSAATDQQGDDEPRRQHREGDGDDVALGE